MGVTWYNYISRKTSLAVGWRTSWRMERTSGSGGQWPTTLGFTCWMRMAGWGTVMIEVGEEDRLDISFRGRTGLCWNRVW